ncbi:MAG: hypothetical protein JRN44_00645 [Nitrososphaerota archaeon]|jgi:hypothetical protein|nr:hypothetical protein [Nitrososphaerota archaeon]MDG6941813.1 hypothetical protein [Nitrososphaerota archaeon]MDG6947014.1 hypothetical protein [Nitrososphaerota archaeon]MDG6950574.1 hypothetical protein [Nitrososphaerota archaeon]
MKSKELILPVAAAAALLYIDIEYVGALLGSGILYKATFFELMIVALQVGKTESLLLVPKLRKASGAFVIDFYGADILALPVLVALDLLVGGTLIPALAQGLVLGWVLGVSACGMGFLAFRVGASMYRSDGLTKVIPTCLATAELGLLFVNSAHSAATSGGDPGAIIRSAFSGYLSFSSSDPIYLDFAALYLILLLYATVGWAIRAGGVEPRQILVAVAATGATAGWAFVASFTGIYPPLVLAPPALGLVAVSWGISVAK